MFFGRRLTEASIHQLLNSYYLPGSWLTIKIYFQYFYEEQVRPTPLICCYPSCYFLLATVYKFCWSAECWMRYELLFSYESLRSAASTRSDAHFKNAVLQPLPRPKESEILRRGACIWAGLWEDVELWAEPRSTESLGNEASALLDGEGFHYV